MKNPPGDWEHIIPDSIGGNLQARTLCNACNKTLGKELIGKLKLNASIRLAMENLKSELPSLYSKFMNKATFIGNAKDGSKIRVSNNSKSGPRVLITRGNDGSRIQDTGEAHTTLEKLLTKSDVNPDEKNRMLRIFTEIDEETPLEVLGKYTFIKHRIPPLRPELNPKEKIDDRFPTTIASEFLALLIGNLILTEAFDEIRQYIRYGTLTNRVTIEQFAGGKKYDTIHAIVVEPIDKAIRISVRLFRWITYVVTFNNYNYRGFDSIYLEDLKAHKSFFAKTREEAKQNIWYELQ